MCFNIGHKEEVSTLAVQHSGSALASASPAFDSSPCEIRIWKITSGKCTKVFFLNTCNFVFYLMYKLNCGLVIIKILYI